MVRWYTQLPEYKHNHFIKKWVYEAFEAGDEVELTALDVGFSIEDAYEDVIFDKDEKDK